MKKHAGHFKKGSNKSLKHGLSHTKIYYVWQAMRRRCIETKNKDYSHYGGRGIVFDSRWNDFAVFLKEMKDTYREGLELDRIDNNGNYSKENCRWADRTTQTNNSRNNHYLEFQGERLTLAQWSRKLGINYSTIRARCQRGNSLQEILSSKLLN